MLELLIKRWVLVLQSIDPGSSPVTTAIACNGSMESSSSDRVELPTAFEDTPIDSLVEVIGKVLRSPSGVKHWLIVHRHLADMLQRLMTHNDRIPLLP